MRIIAFILLWIASCHLTIEAQDEHLVDSNAVVIKLFWENWYGQRGADMILLFPVDHAVKNVFPNGKSFGVSIDRALFLKNNIKNMNFWSNE